MQIDQDISLPSALALPLNQALQKSNHAQFALMFSLLFEQGSQFSPSRSAQTDSDSSQPVFVQPQSYNLNDSLNRSLQSNSIAHFHLMKSLYQERYLELPVSQELVNTHAPKAAAIENLSANTDSLLADLQSAQSSLAA